MPIPAHIRMKKTRIPMPQARRACSDMLGPLTHASLDLCKAFPARGGCLSRGREPDGPYMRKFFANLVAAAGFSMAVAVALPASAAHSALPATPTTIAAYAQAIRHINPE